MSLLSNRTEVVALSGTPPPPSLHDLVKRIAPRPIYLVYAEYGVGGEELNRNFYRAAAQPKRLWRVDEAHHTGGHQANPTGYEQRVIGFFDNALLARS